MNYLIGLICFLFVAVFSSQTLVDICDTMIVVTAIYLIIKNKDYAFLNHIKKTWVFWMAWLVVIFFGLYLNTEKFPWVCFLEFRWFFTFFAMIYILSEIKDKSILIQYVALTMLILNFTAIALYFYRGDNRAGGIYNGIMAFSQNIGLVASFFITYVSCVFKFKIKMQTYLKYIFLSVALTSIILVLLTLTRGVWIAAAVGISMTAFLIPKKVFIYTVLCTVFIFTVYSFLNANFKQRVYSEDASSKISNSQRINIWTANLKMLKDFPILGVGYSQNNLRLTEYYDKLNIPQTELKSHAHNQYLHMASGTGLIGLFFFLIFIGFIFYQAIQVYFKADNQHTKIIYLSLTSAFICFIVAGLTESNFSISKNRFLILFFCAFIATYRVTQKLKKQH